MNLTDRAERWECEHPVAFVVLCVAVMAALVVIGLALYAVKA